MSVRDVSAVLIRCALEDEASARRVLEAWPADRELPYGLAIENEGNFRRLTASDGYSFGWILLTNAQWETLVSMGGPAEHLARVLGEHAARAQAR